MPSESKIWVYAANRILIPQEQLEISQMASAFITNWTAHQQELKAAFTIVHNIFMIISVDENYNQVSGCGIDKSIHFMQEVDKKYNLNVFHRLQIELWQHEQVILTNKQKLSVMLQDGSVNQHTLMFNKNITTKHQYDLQFQVPLSQSWVYPSLKPNIMS